MNYSEFRSALYNDRHVEAFQIMNSLDHPDEKEIANKLWWRLVKPELVAPDLSWSGKEDGELSLWYIDDKKWTLSLSGVIIATNETLDLKPIQAKWAMVPARYVLPIWETWAKENIPEHLYCVRELLDLIDQGADPKTIELAKEAVETGRSAAYWAAKSADSAPYWAARAADWAARAAARAASAVSFAASFAARAAARASSYAADSSARSGLYESEYKRWCLKWTKHVFTVIKESK